jgi:hypothetical protein
MSAQLVQKIPCSKCGALILPSTAEKMGGLCMPCTRQPHSFSPARADDLDSLVEAFRTRAMSGMPRGNAPPITGSSARGLITTERTIRNCSLKFRFKC